MNAQPAEPYSRGDDRHALYELCVQRPDVLVPWLEALHDGNPRVLHEDFCGSGAVSRDWVARGDDRVAVGVDLDADTAALAGGLAARLCGVSAPRVHIHEGDVLDSPLLLRAEPRADVVFAGNFSIGELPERDLLLQYLQGVRSRLRESGIFVCDTYGGAAAWRTGHVQRMFVAPDGAVVRYTWEQRRADPFTARVENALHFLVEREGEIVTRSHDAFVYRWRLWSFPELADALREAGFARIDTASTIGGAAAPPDPGEALVIACLVARAD